MRFSSIVLLVSVTAVSVNGCSVENSTAPGSAPADLHGNYSGPIGGSSLDLGETFTGTLSLSFTKAQGTYKGTFSIAGTITGTPTIPVTMAGTVDAYVKTHYWPVDIGAGEVTEILLHLTDSANPTCLHEIRGAYQSTDRSIHINDNSYLAIIPTSDCTQTSHVFFPVGGYVSPV